jgi:hypothetical protein
VFVEVHQQIPRDLRDPVTGWVGSDADQVDAAAFEFDDEQYVEPGHADRFHGEEVAGEHAFGLAAKDGTVSTSARRVEVPGQGDGGAEWSAPTLLRPGRRA